MSSFNSSGVKREDKGRNIQVVVRCRPFNTDERKSTYNIIDCDQNRKEVAVKSGGLADKTSRKTYTFDMVFGQAAKQIDVYRSVVCPILDEVIMGYNCTVFAYGQTGTGKTFTMEGERTPDEQFTWEEDPLAGIIPRTLHQIFEKLSENGTEFSVKVSLLEIYNEELFDLLSPSEEVNERLQLFDDPRNKRGVVVKGLEEVTVHNKDEVYQILERGAAKRRTASTLMNAYSSRSHSVFSVTIHMKEITVDGEELVKIGKLNLVDLAGSENIGRSGAVDKRAREAGNINQSLLTLGRVITALVEKRPHIPYRESKLTRILQDSLGGRTKTSIIATVSPASSNLEETLSTLEYASRAKNIMNKPEVNQKLTKRTLIKEYTEEIERLKRELAATRDKNGIYLAAQNYEKIMGQINSQEEQIADYVEKIAAMEEELRKVSELFQDSKSQLERCAVDLDQKQQRLEETSKDLQETKEKLVKEEFVCSELSLAQENLSNTAGQLLSAVDQSTGDVSGLHDKLDRKKKVEQHNQQIQQGFAQQMDGAFSSIQRCIQQQGEQQRRMLSGYSKAIDGLLQTNEAALKGALTSVQSLVGRVDPLLADGAARFREKVQQQKALSQQEKESMLQLLEDHRQDLEEVLVAQTLTGLSAVKELCDTLRVSMETQQALANEVEMMKETGVFFSGLVQQVAALRQDTVQRLSALQDERDALEDQIQEVQQRQEESLKQTIQRLQDQLNQDFSSLRSASRGLQGPLQSLQEDVLSGCSRVEDQASGRADFLSTASLTLATSLCQSADGSLQAVGELRKQCSHIHSSVSGLVQRDRRWSCRMSEEAERRAEEQLAVMEEIHCEAESLKKSVEAFCSQELQAVEEELRGSQAEAQHALTAVQDQTSVDSRALEQQEAELQERVEAGQRLVGSFLQDELKHDVPTGATPRRREFVYPREVAKSQTRSELLESLRRQQEELQAALKEEEEEKGSQPHHDSVEDELSTNENLPTIPSSIDDSLVFNQSERVPFFKKKGGKNLTKIPSRPKALENEVPQTPPKFRPPFRCLN